MMTLQKIADTSHWSGHLDVAQSRPYIQGIIAKVSESDDWGPDSEWISTRDQSLDCGMPYSAYHFARFDADPIQQAMWFIECMGVHKPRVVWWDAETLAAQALGIERGASVEVWKGAIRRTDTLLFKDDAFTDKERAAVDAAHWLTSGQVLIDTLKWLQYMHSKGYEAGIYSSVSFIQAYLQGDPALAEFSLWIAHPYQQEPTIPAPWAQYGKWGVNPRVPLWQYSWQEQVPGFPEKSVDMNYLSPLCEEAHLFFENGYPYEEEPGDMPNIIRVNTPNSYANLRKSPWGAINGKAPHGLMMFVTDQQTDANGKMWYACGTGWIASWIVEVIQ